MLSGTDYNPACFLLAHIHVTLLMNYNSTKGHSVGATRCPFTRHATHCTLSDDGSSVKVTIRVCYKLLIHFTLKGTVSSLHDASCRNMHTLTLDTFLFLHDVSECEETVLKLQTSILLLKINRCGGERDKDTLLCSIISGEMNAACNLLLGVSIVTYVLFCTQCIFDSHVLPWHLFSNVFKITLQLVFS